VNEEQPKNEIFTLKINNDILAITSFIPEYRLTHAKEDDILFQSGIKKLLNQRVGNHISQSFAQRFLIATKVVLSFYTSKERFLVLSKPKNIIYISSIKSVKRFYLKGNVKHHLFVIEIGDNKTGIDC
jgi:hypothetical protein